MRQQLLFESMPCFTGNAEEPALGSGKKAVCAIGLLSGGPLVRPSLPGFVSHRGQEVESGLAKRVGREGKFFLNTPQELTFVQCKDIIKWYMVGAFCPAAFVSGLRFSRKRHFSV